jgi:anion-transporting  ArsA/GET3 family ATPase
LDAENPMAEIGERQMKYRGLGQSTDTQYVERENIPEFDIVICDFPPTGNMIALFEIPADSTQRLMKLTLRTTSSITKSIGKLKKIGKLLRPATWLTAKVLKDERDPDTILDKEEQRNLAQEILDILHDMEERSLRITQLMKGIGSLRLVSIAEKPSFEETKRARDLSLPYISVDALHINRLIPESEKGNSPFLDKIIVNEEKYRHLLHQEFSQQKRWDSNLLDHPPIGLSGLLRLALEVYEETPIEEILNPLHRELHLPEKKDTYRRFRIDEFEAQLKKELK